MKRKPRVYIAGPISRGPLGHNIKQADEAFLELVRRGFAPFNPILTVFAGHAAEAPPHVAVPSAMSGLPIPHDVWLSIDLPWVEAADCVLRLPGFSIGANIEANHARGLGIPVFTSVDDLHNYAIERGML